MVQGGREIRPIRMSSSPPSGTHRPESVHIVYDFRSSSIHDRDWVVVGPHRHARAQRPGPAVRPESDWAPVACALTMINSCEGASAALRHPRPPRWRPSVPARRARPLRSLGRLAPRWVCVCVSSPSGPRASRCVGRVRFPGSRDIIKHKACGSGDS
ncbi:hypothetical protein NDU88_005732 [Pleurodeles waltl]|uniref:Uncharacterized protein n=1 Tax=Pleurodeles waltl TaxID=8319 RepID=A0AAV7TBV0_PLEWA|nr:hypothetical protein NDU88_005732 [Pleurodeles waltl]